MQSQLMCSSCRSVLLYPKGATNVCCAICRAITSVPPPGMEIAQLICGGCRTLLMYSRGAATIRCSCCQTVNLAPASSQIAHVNCGNCRTTLMYPYGAPTVKCALCEFVTNVDTNNARVPIPIARPNATATMLSTSTQAMPHIQNQTVVVENPMSVDESGKLVTAQNYALMDLRTLDLADMVVPDAMEPADEWTLVLPRHGKKRRTFLDHKASEVQLGEWAPTDAEISPERENKLLLKIEASMKILGSSAFFISFMEQIRHKLMKFFTRMLGPELKLQMIVYGIGSIEAYENPRLQLSLALLMKRELEWIGEVEVFDPVLSVTESRVITSLGCSVISVNEEGKRKVLKPTLFFVGGFIKQIEMVTFFCMICIS